MIVFSLLPQQQQQQDPNVPASYYDPSDDIPLPTNKPAGGSGGMPSWADYMKELEKDGGGAESAAAAPVPKKAPAAAKKAPAAAAAKKAAEPVLSAGKQINA